MKWTTATGQTCSWGGCETSATREWTEDIPLCAQHMTEWIARPVREWGRIRDLITPGWRAKERARTDALLARVKNNGASRPPTRRW